MQPTEQQVQRSLAALRDTDGDLVVGSLAPVTAKVEPDAVSPDAGLATGGEVPDGLSQRLEAAPRLRPERLEAAQRWLAEGRQPSAEQLAQRMVGRLVCDRLR